MRIQGKDSNGEAPAKTVFFWFVAVFSGSVAREGEFPSDEVEHGGHVFHRPVPASLTLHG